MPYRFAIIGAGRIGSRHAGLASCFGKLGAVADTDPEKSQIVAGQYHARAYSRLESLPEAAPANQYGFYEESMSNHDKLDENLIRELQDPKNRLVDAADALQSIAMIEKIYLSSALLSHSDPEPAS